MIALIIGLVLLALGMFCLTRSNDFFIKCMCYKEKESKKTKKILIYIRLFGLISLIAGILLIVFNG
jgi:uncharacterized membrane protein HdeD (DUF308 family)